MITRRRLIAGLASTVAGFFVSRRAALANQKEATQTSVDSLRFPGDPTDHNVVYQLNKSSEKYHNGVLFSIGAMLRKYDDNITIVVTVFGAGIHVLAKNPTRPVAEKNKQSIKSLADYGIKFHACGNTLISLGWDKNDLYDFVEIVPVGASDLMELQEQGYSYISL